MKKKSYPSAEYRLLASLKPFLNHPATARYPLPIGDDAAIRNCVSGEKLILTADSFVEEVHFRLSYMSLSEAGYKAMAINLSDCAAMAAEPDGALVQVIFPGTLPSAGIVAEVKQLYKGLGSACRRWNIPIVGGNLSAGPCWIVDITLLGRVQKNGRILLRTGARPGDGLWVTGRPGESAAGLAALTRWGRRGVPRIYGPLVTRHIRPAPRMEVGRALGRDARVRALIDVSDGISKECRTLAYENRLGISLDGEPACVSRMAKRLSARLNVDWRDWYLNGGEDYELLFAADPSFSPGRIESRTGVPLTRIGWFGAASAAPSVTFGEQGAIGPAGGWDHLRNKLRK